MILKEIKSKSCMVKSKLTDYVINPYIGCQHGCKYCYADFIRRFQHIKENWGDFVFPKVNCPELLEKELKKNKAGHIWLSSVCDCYMPLERKLKLTRKILKVINNSPYKNKFSLEILTKSSLVKRDFDLLKKLNAELGCSLNTLLLGFAQILIFLFAPAGVHQLGAFPTLTIREISPQSFGQIAFVFDKIEKLLLSDQRKPNNEIKISHNQG